MTKTEAHDGLQLLLSASSMMIRRCDSIDLARLADVFANMPKNSFLQLTVADVLRVLVVFDPDAPRVDE